MDRKGFIKAVVVLAGSTVVPDIAPLTPGVGGTAFKVTLDKAWMREGLEECQDRMPIEDLPAFGFVTIVKGDMTWHMATS